MGTNGSVWQDLVLRVCVMNISVLSAGILGGMRGHP